MKIFVKYIIQIPMWNTITKCFYHTHNKGNTDSHTEALWEEMKAVMTKVQMNTKTD